MLKEFFPQDVEILDKKISCFLRHSYKKMTFPCSEMTRVEKMIFIIYAYNFKKIYSNFTKMESMEEHV